MKITVGGREHLIVIPENIGAKNIGHPLSYLVKQPGSTVHYLNLVFDLVKTLPKGKHVTELYGGIGLFPKVFWDEMEPLSWTAVEIDPDCATCHQEPRVTLLIQDAYKYRGLGQIVFVDSPNGTLRTIADNMDGRRAMYERIKEERPEHVVVTDHGYYWIHLPNHHPWYLQEFGEKPTKSNYHIFWDTWMRRNVGYRVEKWNVGAGTQHFHMKPL